MSSFGVRIGIIEKTPVKERITVPGTLDLIDALEVAVYQPADFAISPLGVRQDARVSETG